MTAQGYRVSFGGDGHVLKLTIVVAQLCEYTWSHWTVCVKWVNYKYVYYISIKLLMKRLLQLVLPQSQRRNHLLWQFGLYPKHFQHWQLAALWSSCFMGSIWVIKVFLILTWNLPIVASTLDPFIASRALWLGLSQRASSTRPKLVPRCVFV